MTLTYTDKNNCIIQNTNVNNVFEYSYNLSEIMRIAKREYKFLKRFGESWSHVLKLVWSNARKIMNHYRSAASKSTTPFHKVKINVNPKTNLIY